MPDSSARATTIAIPKGRVLKQLLPILQNAEIDTEPLTRESRKLIRATRTRTGAPLRFLMLKPDDVPTYVEYGAAELGIVGRDVLLERSYDLFVPLELGIGRCRVAVCGRPGEKTTALGRPLRIATKFPEIAKRHFDQRGVPVELIYVGGSVELAPLTGLADLIVDIVETGETLRQNGLEVLEDICEVSAVVVGNRVGIKLAQERVQPLINALASAVAAT